MTRNEERLDLILQYLNNRLDDRKKPEFFQLLRADEDFRMLFAGEWKLYRGMQHFKAAMQEKRKKQVLTDIQREITGSRFCREQAINAFIFRLFEMILPDLAVPYFKKLERRLV